MEDLSRAIESAEGVFPDDFYASVKVEVMKAFGLLLREMPDRFDLVIGLNTSVRPSDARRMARTWLLAEGCLGLGRESEGCLWRCCGVWARDGDLGKGDCPGFFLVG